ncbi:hypothetical protein C8J57DRAFT_1510755 [Mycena rebaudengoi]|nr:hypothetical protein C8J57DRAFT_1510755 [Mycena rebaudengoi]
MLVVFHPHRPLPILSCHSVPLPPPAFVLPFDGPNPSPPAARAQTSAARLRPTATGASSAIWPSLLSTIHVLNPPAYPQFSGLPEGCNLPAPQELPPQVPEAWRLSRSRIFCLAYLNRLDPFGPRRGAVSPVCMGGGVVVRACPRLLELKYRVSGVAVLDVVEAPRWKPSRTCSPEAAIEWQWAKTIHIATSACLRPRPVCRRTSNDVAVIDGAVVGYLIPLIPLLLLAPVLVLALLPPTSHASDCFLHLPPFPSILRLSAPPFLVLSSSSPRSPLRWLTGLSAVFHAARTARLLLLAGMDRLDRPLMITQMVGPIFCVYTSLSPFSGTSLLLRLLFSQSRSYPTVFATPTYLSPPALLPSTHPHRRPRFFLYTYPPPPHLLLQNDLTGAAGSCSSFGGAGRNERVLLLLPLDNGWKDKWKGVGGGLGDLLTTGVLLLLVLRPLAFASFRFDLVTGECGFAAVQWSPPLLLKSLPSFAFLSLVCSYPLLPSLLFPIFPEAFLLFNRRASPRLRTHARFGLTCAVACYLPALDVGVWFGLVTSARVVNRPRASPRRMRRGEVTPASPKSQQLLDESGRSQGSMRVPQEIADKIIDNFAMSHDDKISRNRYWREPGEPVDADSLRACSLTSRSFLRRSRMHLFAAFFCQYLSDFSHFDRLLAESPHIGELYVRYFKMTIRDCVAPLLTEDVVLPRILSRLPSLTHVTLYYPSSYNVWPSLLKASIQTTLSLHCLRSLCLNWIRFANTSELELLLGHATGLKALTLDNIHFDNPSVCRVDVPHEVRVVLESLELELETNVVDATPANAQTIQKVRASFPRDPMEPLDPDILKGNQTLHSIEIAEDSSEMVSALQQFGRLGYLKALKTISLDFTDRVKYASPSTVVDWPELDAILSPAVDGLEDIHIHRRGPPRIIQDPAATANTRHQIPSLSLSEVVTQKSSCYTIVMLLRKTSAGSLARPGGSGMRVRGVGVERREHRRIVHDDNHKRKDAPFKYENLIAEKVATRRVSGYQDVSTPSSLDIPIVTDCHCGTCTTSTSTAPTPGHRHHSHARLASQLLPPLLVPPNRGRRRLPDAGGSYLGGTSGDVRRPEHRRLPLAAPAKKSQLYWHSSAGKSSSPFLVHTRLLTAFFGVITRLLLPVRRAPEGLGQRGGLDWAVAAEHVGGWRLVSCVSNSGVLFLLQLAHPPYPLILDCSPSTSTTLFPPLASPFHERGWRYA